MHREQTERTHAPIDRMPRCTATTSQGNRCKSPAMRGQQVCRMHGGMAPQNLAAAERRIAELKVRAELERVGIPVPTDSLAALMDALARAAGSVAYITQELHRRQGIAEDADKHGAMVLTQEGQHSPEVAALMRLYLEVLDKQARYAKMALDAGVDERMIRVAEGQGRMLVEAMDLTFTELALTAEQTTEGRALVAKHLRILNA